MLKYINDNHELYSFDDMNPTIIGHKIRWVKENPEGYIDGEQGRYVTVASYEERSKTINRDNRIDVTRTEIRLSTKDGEFFTVSPDEKFTTNFPSYLTGADRFSPTAPLAEYTYDAVGADVVGNAIMVTTGKDSNHSWGDFITGRVVAYTVSAAKPLFLINRDSVLYNVFIEGLDRPIVVDSFSSFWA